MSVEFTAVRSEVKAFLVAALGTGWLVYDYAKDLQGMNPGVGVVVISRTKVEPAMTGLRSTTLELHVIEPKVDPEAAEDALEVRLDAVLDAINASALESAFKGAERGMYKVGESAAHSYVITLEILTGK